MSDSVHGSPPCCWVKDKSTVACRVKERQNSRETYSMKNKLNWHLFNVILYCFNIFSISKYNQSGVDGSVKKVTGFAAVLDRKLLKMLLSFETEQSISAVYSRVKMTDHSIESHHRWAEKIKK